MKDNQTKLTVQVQPNARQNELLGFRQGILNLKIAAPPIKGKANQELIKYLSEILGTAKSKITIQKGMTGKKKVIGIEGLNQDQIMEKMSALLNESKV